MSKKKPGKPGGSRPGIIEKQKQFGKMVLLWNMSGVDQFCPTTGTKLPIKGMVVQHNGQLYIDQSAARLAGQVG